MNFFIPPPSSSESMPTLSSVLASLPLPDVSVDSSFTKTKGKRGSSEENLDGKKKNRLTNAEKGYEVCGHNNKFKKPCQRVGVCPFHHKMGINPVLDDRAIARKLKKESKKAKEAGLTESHLNSISAQPLIKHEEGVWESYEKNLQMFSEGFTPLQKCSSSSSSGSDIGNPAVSDVEDNFISELWMTAAFSDIPPTTDADFKDFRDPFEGLYPPYSFSVPAFSYANSYQQIV
eukprot:TRINITY_DN6673_c0_g1_i1.p1 TRINITY_DN6673_c0_g1~~TRINITY_DN6673_c0_g1_i1.p1  ORF type:complete len:232 (+),score=72.43 TRINITY_DN6673_c0_g1_i1:201-896(+)